MKLIKKITACAAALAVVLTTTGCMDDGYIMTVDGMRVRNGVYLSFQQQSFTEASDILTDELEQSQAAEKNNSDTSDNTESPDDDDSVFNKTVEGKPWSDWVKDYTLKAVLRFVGIQRQCEELGISLTDDELSEINESVENNWNSANEYMYYIYGITALGQYYESVGIGLDSLKEIARVNKLNEKLFEHYYSEGGEFAPTQEEYDKFVDENYAAYRLLTIPYYDYMGVPLVLDEDKEELNELAREYADRLNDGEGFVDVKYDEDLRNAQNDARADAEESYDEDPTIADGLSRDEFVQQAIDDAEAERGDDDSYYNEVLYKDDEILTEELTDFIFGLPKDGKASVFKGENSVYVVVKLSIDDLDGWEDSNHINVLSNMYGEEFDSKMDIMCQNYDVDMNSYLVNKKYSPEKMYG